MDEIDPPERDIKMFFPAPTFYLKTHFSLFGKMERFMLWKKNDKEKKYSCYFVYKSPFVSSSEFVLKNEEKLVALLVYSPFRRIPIKMLRATSLITSSGSEVSHYECR